MVTESRPTWYPKFTVESMDGFHRNTHTHTINSQMQKAMKCVHFTEYEKCSYILILMYPQLSSTMSPVNQTLNYDY